MNCKIAFLLSVAMLLIAGCSSKIPTPQERQKNLFTLASDHNLSIKFIKTARFDLLSMVSKPYEDKTMRVYIEGDGLSWISRSKLSDDPTPTNPLAAKLMIIDDSRSKAYLARPCQYTEESGCDSKYWSSHRFSPEVIHSYNEALNHLKKEYGIETFTLIGYSGGAAVASLLASQRTDVKELITIAGNLDTKEWVRYHAVAPLEGSLNPADFSNSLESVSQTHLIGKDDTIIPHAVFEAYRRHFNNKTNIRSYLYEGVTHHHGWEDVWKKFNKDHQSL